MQEASTPALVPLDPGANVTDILEQRVAATPDLALFAVPRSDGGWDDVTAADFRARVVRIAKGLIARGLEPGDRIGFMCHTKYEWTLVDFAIWYAGAVMVPIYETSSATQLQWNLSDSGAVALIVESDIHAERFDEVSDELGDIRWMLRLDGGGLEELERLGAAVTDAQVEERRARAVGADPATLIYTSGSSGRPKGVVLTHTNFVELARNDGAALPEVAHPGASTLLFITLAHVYARFISVLGVHTGVRVGHQSDLKKLLPSLESFQPTFLLAVPRVFEKVYNSAEAKAEAGGKGRIFRAAVRAAVEHSQALDAGKVPFGLALRFRILDRLVLSKLRAALGGRATYAISGSAPLGEHLAHFYRSLGLQILEGYGLTETTAPATVNLPSKFKIGTTGPAVPGVSIRISDDGEVLLRGPSVFTEYWKNPEATAAAFDDEGWFRTGDIGTLDDDGYLSITGRKKEIIVTAGGKNVAPAVLEDAIRAHILVSQVVVVGEARPYIAALVTLDAEMLPAWLHNAGLDTSLTPAQAAAHPSVIAAVQTAVDGANAAVSRAESVRRFVILPTDFTEASGHLTPKLSIKRYAILADFAEEIDAVYRMAHTSDATETISVAG